MLGENVKCSETSQTIYLDNQKADDLFYINPDYFMFVKSSLTFPQEAQKLTTKI